LLTLGAVVGWVGAVAGFYAYTSWFSESDRGDVVLVLSWLAVLVGLAATFAVAAVAALAVGNRVRDRA